MPCFVKTFFPNDNPIGRRFGLGPNNSNGFEIVGVVGNTRYNSLRERAGRELLSGVSSGRDGALRDSHGRRRPANLASAVRTRGRGHRSGGAAHGVPHASRR